MQSISIRIRKLLLTSLTGSALFLVATAPATAHSVTTASGAYVSHGHYGYCGPNGCPGSDSSFESAFGFSSSHRWYSGTGEWNCHGRTFDARRSWIGLAEPYLNNDGAYCPVSPSYGDSIIWWSGGQSSHSVTIVGSWNGTSTTTMSKYGTQGQYRHSLANVVAVYGSNWAVTNFSAGTTIYSGLTTGEETSANEKSRVSFSRPVDLLEQRKHMPWYEDVLKSEAIYEVEHPRLVAQIAQLTEKGKEAYLNATGDQERVAALLDDLRDASHFEFLGVYNHPSFAEDFIEEIEAGKLLVKMVKKRPETEKLVIDGLTDALLTEKSLQADRVRGAVLHFLSALLDDESRRLIADDLKPLEKSLDAGESSYFTYYLSKM